MIFKINRIILSILQILEILSNYGLITNGSSI
jgi:hypothetical protein